MPRSDVSPASINPHIPGSDLSPYPFGHYTLAAADRPPTVSRGRRTNRIASAALIFGVLGLVLIWLPYVSWLCAAMAIGFGFAGLLRVGATSVGFRSAIAGLLLGGLIIAAWAVLVMSAFDGWTAN